MRYYCVICQHEFRPQALTNACRKCGSAKWVRYSKNDQRINHHGR